MARNLPEHLDEMKHLAAENAVSTIRNRKKIATLDEVELSVHSQWGDDGILQWLVAQFPGVPKRFVEIGVEDYVESTTRYLLMHNNWSGLVVDGSRQNVAKIRRSHYFWRYELRAIQAFITRDNAGDLMRSHGYFDELGVLHIDIDGMDYWVWEALECKPAIAVIEYNSVFGGDRAITVPYDAEFDRTKAHYSNLYFGASLPALCVLAKRKGYVFLGATSAGNNAYFLREDLISDAVSELVTNADYVESRFRESRDGDGELSYLVGDQRLEAIRDLPVYDVELDQVVDL